MQRIVIVEDDSRYRASLETLFEYSSGFSLWNSFESGAAAVEHVRKAVSEGKPPSWDLILMDVDLPGMTGVEATKQIKAILPETKIVILTVFEEPATILSAICSGADGYLLKRSSTSSLLAQLRVISGDGAPLTAGVARVILDLLRDSEHDSPPQSAAGPSPQIDSKVSLSSREQDVLNGLVRGLAYKQVADELDISIDTVRTHVRGIYKKLQVNSAAEAVGRAIRDRLV